jgi:metal transporter CNNM
VFTLNFLADKSKFYNSSTLRFMKKRNSDRILSKNTLLVAETAVRLKHNSSKYYACVHFKKKSADLNDKQLITNNESDIHSLKFVHQGTSNVWTQIITTKELLPIYLVIVFYFVLLCFSALFSGLNLGLMSLDLTELEHLKNIGTEKEKSYALKIYPLRAKGNLLLCTILIGNVLVNSTSTLILGNYLEGIFAAMGSTLLIVVFGEIIPQAACSRHGLAVGAHTRYVTYFMMGLTYVVSYPLSLILDKFLGKELAAVYTRDKVRELMRRAKDGQVDGFDNRQFKLVSGALDFKNKNVVDIMVKIKDVFSLDINSTLDFDTFKTILYHGYSRIPVYEYTKLVFLFLYLVYICQFHI